MFVKSSSNLRKRGVLFSCKFAGSSSLNLDCSDPVDRVGVLHCWDYRWGGGMDICAVSCFRAQWEVSYANETFSGIVSSLIGYIMLGTSNIYSCMYTKGNVIERNNSRQRT